MWICIDLERDKECGGQMQTVDDWLSSITKTWPNIGLSRHLVKRDSFVFFSSPASCVTISPAQALFLRSSIKQCERSRQILSNTRDHKESKERGNIAKYKRSHKVKDKNRQFIVRQNPCFNQSVCPASITVKHCKSAKLPWRHKIKHSLWFLSFCLIAFLSCGF